MDHNQYLKSGKIAGLILAGLLTFSSCSSSDDDIKKEPTTTTTTTNNYVLLTGDLTASPYVGYISTFSSLPSGDFSNIKEGSLSVKANGIKYYGKWIFQRLQLGRVQSTDDGILRYSLDSKGNMVQDGEIKGMSSNFYIYNDTTGYYADTNRGLLKLQVFNPSTMQRTGEIDLSAVATSQYGPYQSVASSLIVAKNGKLYVDIIYGTKEGKGSFLLEDAKGFVDIAVIDIATMKYEKTIRDKRINSVGYPGNANQMWAIGDDGALYLCAHGLGKTGATNGSAVVRIKANETDFDNNWIIKSDNYSSNTSISTVAVKGGKLYTSWGAKPLSYAGMLTDVTYSYYAFDVENLSAGPQKIANTPETTYSFQNAQNITVLDNNVYFRTVNNAKTNGYYVLDGTNSAKPAFNITSGGIVWGIAKLNH